MYFTRFYFQIDGENDEKDYYESLLNRCIRTAIEMSRRGIDSNDIIGICSSNHLNTCVPFVAATFLGAKVTPLASKLPMPDMIHLLKSTKPKIVFVDVPFLKVIIDAAEQASVATEIVSFGPTDIETSFSVFLSPKEDEKTFKPYEVESSKETALIYFSSGTTGLPKGICLSHHGVINGIQPLV